MKYNKTVAFFIFVSSFSMTISADSINAVIRTQLVKDTQNKTFQLESLSTPLLLTIKGIFDKPILTSSAASLDNIKLQSEVDNVLETRPEFALSPNNIKDLKNQKVHPPTFPIDKVVDSISTKGSWYPILRNKSMLYTNKKEISIIRKTHPDAYRQLLTFYEKAEQICTLFNITLPTPVY